MADASNSAAIAAARRQYHQPHSLKAESSSASSHGTLSRLQEAETRPPWTRIAGRAMNVDNPVDLEELAGSGKAINLTVRTESRRRTTLGRIVRHAWTRSRRNAFWYYARPMNQSGKGRFISIASHELPDAYCRAYQVLMLIQRPTKQV